MKKLFFILFGLLLCLSGFAQLKHFLPRTNGVMSITNQKYLFDGDTIISDKNYIKVYKQHCTSATRCRELMYYAAVREDVEEEKIYCIGAHDGVERLLVDFDVQVGDKITLYSYIIDGGGIIEQEVKVDQINTILIDGQHRKQVNVSFDSPFGEHNVSFVEGIGSILQGLFFAFDFGDEGVIDGKNMPILNCLHIDDILVYKNSCCSIDCYSYLYFMEGYGNCIEECMEDNPEKSRYECDFYCVFHRWSNIQEINPDNFKVYPVPTNDILYIDVAFYSCLYEIYDVQGKAIQSGLVSDNSVNVSLLNQGIYYILLRNDDETYASKFIKQ